MDRPQYPSQYSSVPAGSDEYKAYDPPHALTPLHRDTDTTPVLEDYAGRTRPQRARHLWPLIILIAWICYIAVVVVLLERAAALAPTTTSRPWWLSTLPSFLSTVFAQAHGPITAIYLGRLAISGLQSPNTAPHSWAELFSLANGEWQGPMGLVTWLTSMGKRRSGVSATFLTLTVTCLLAAVIPAVLDRAYPIETIDVARTVVIRPNTMSPDDLAAVDGYSQVMIGGGTWSTQLSVAEAFNASVYTPAGANRTSSPQDFFIAGEVEGMDVALPGIRVQGSCAPYTADSVTDAASFEAFCATQLDANSSTDGGNYHYREFSIPYWSVNVTGAGCVNQDFDAGLWYDAPGTAGTASFMWLNATNGTASTTGLVHCAVNVTSGRAALNGRQGTFDAFNFTVFNNFTNGGEPIQHPHLLAHYRLSDVTDESQYNWASQISMLGYREGILGDGKGGMSFEQPSLERFADQMWSGTGHMAVAATLQTRRSDHDYTAVSHTAVAGRVRDTWWAIAVLALLGAWLLMLVICSVRMSPVLKSFGGSLDSYVVARLTTDHPELFEGQRVGELDDNVRLRARFGYVNRDGYVGG